MATTKYEYLDADALSRLKNLTLAARRIVEGFFAGMHRSPHRGFSIEFAEHREYTPGVDPRHIDWKALARRDKLYIKQYEEETSLRCFLLLDTSASMDFGTTPLTKLRYASFLAASLAYLMSLQSDAVGLVTFDAKVKSQIPARQGTSNLRPIMTTLEAISPGGESLLAGVFDPLAESLPRRSLIVVLSDLLDDPQSIIRSLRHFRGNRSEVVVFQILDPAEIEFPFEDVTLVEDAESGRQVAGDPAALRQGYLDEFERHQSQLQQGLVGAGIDYVVANTRQPFDRFLADFLTRRQRLAARA